MIVRNWINRCAFRGTGTSADGAHTKNTAGNIATGSWGPYLYNTVGCNVYFSSASVSAYGVGICLGSGTTPATIDDFKLETPITTLTEGSKTSSLNTLNNYDTECVATFTQTVGNNTESNITVSEIGLFQPVSNVRVLLSRDVINPVIIAPNESKTFVVSINFADMSATVSAN